MDLILSGLALGLYGGRVLLEIFPRTFPGLASLLATAVLILVGVSLAAVGRRRGLDLAPLLVLYLYVLWPWIHPVLALSVAFVAGVAIVRPYVGRFPPLFSDVLLFVVSLALYVHTLAPTILPADSGEFQFVSYVLGIAHPPGYPLYIMLAKWFTYLPLGDIAYRVNFFSALTSALTLVVLSRTVRRVTGSGAAGWIAAVGLGVAPTFWAQSTTANIRSLTALFTALQLSALIAYAQSRGLLGGAQTENATHLIAFALALGLGITHHTSLVPLTLPYVAFLLVSDPGLVRNPRSLIRPFLAFLLSLPILLYLPLRSALGAPFDPQPIRSLSGFVEHVLALGFRADMFYFTQPAVLLSRFQVLLNILAFQFGPAWLLLGVWGAVSMLLRRSRLLLLCGGVFLVNAVLAITYRAPQTVEYLMPAYVAFAFICAYGAWCLGDRLRSRGASSRALAAVLVAAVLLMPMLALRRNYPSFVQLSQDRSARRYAENVLGQASQGARILSNWHYATPLWYLQYVERMRPDVKVVYVYPEGAEPMPQTWLRRVEETSTEYPTIVTNQYPEFDVLPYTFQPFARAWWVQTGPVSEVAEHIQRLDALFDDRVELAGYKLEDSVVSPTDSLAVHLYWQPAVKLERDYSFFVHLVDETGAVLGQGDTTHPAARYEVGQVILDEYRIPLLPTVKPSRYRLIAGVYITLDDGGWRRLTTEDGRDTVVLGEVEVEALSTAPVTLHELHHPFASGYTLTGADYDYSLPGQLRVYLHWRCDGSVTEGQRAVVFSKEAALAAAGLPIVPAGRYFTTAYDLPAEAMDLAVEVQTIVDETPSTLLGPWKLPLGHRVRLPAPSADERYVALGGEMVLVKAEYPATVDGESSLRTRMTFVGTRPITYDYTVSLSLIGEGDAWRAQHDGTPAMGAIPTLKWIRGITVRDEHDLVLPPNAAGHGKLRLTVYDAFTMQPLPVLDERLARLGQGTQIELGSVEVR